MNTLPSSDDFVAPVLLPWSTQAVNLLEHADNPVHTEAGGLAAGFAGAVVAGTTVYAYLTRPPSAGWGRAWVERGGAEVRFVGPVLADDRLDIVVDGGAPGAPSANGVELAAVVDGTTRATCRVRLDAPTPVEEPEGERLDPLVVALDDRWTGYAARAGEDLELWASEGIVHPVVWPSLANRVFALQLVDGPWVHTRSRIVHQGLAAPGDVAVVESWLMRRFTTRSGERAVAEIRITVDGRPVAAVEHEAIVRVAERSA